MIKQWDSKRNREEKWDYQPGANYFTIYNFHREKRNKANKENLTNVRKYK